MNIEILVDGEAALKLEINETLLKRFLQVHPSNTDAAKVAQSTSLTKAQAEELLSRIDTKSVLFLKQIAANNGSITWSEMMSIFNIDEWRSFSSAHGKGITRALRHILNDKGARLIWWKDEEWEDKEVEDLCRVYVDGEALQALRDATGVGSE